VKIQEYKGQEADEMRVIQRHAHAPVSWALSGHHQLGWKAQTEEELLHEFDEVTVEFRTREKVSHIELRLPLRDICQPTEDGVVEQCDGYTFAHVSDGGCYLRRSSSNHLPDTQAVGGNVSAEDIVRSGRVKLCHVDNSRGNGKKPFQEPKRSTVELHIEPSDSKDWQFFTIFVKNPVASPEGFDLYGIPANAFVVILRGNRGKQILAWAQAAMPIKQPWVCSYSAWRRQSACTARCGGGIRHLYRERLHPPPTDIDPALLIKCDEETISTEECNKFMCDVDCHLSDWIRWADGPCTATCGGGYEVQRRRVVHGAMGKSSRHCPNWRSDVRVRYIPCNIDPCEPDCTVAEDRLPPLPTPNVVISKCSRFCGGGTRNITGLTYRKMGQISADKCYRTHEEPCNEHPCRVLDFYPSRPNDVPELGQWFDVTIIFFLKDLTETFELTAPKGFELEATDTDNCMLVQHDLPNLRGCTVHEADMQSAIFDFYTALEPERKDHPAQYSVRMWVKIPSDCEGNLDAKGVCRADAIDKEWKMCIKTKLPEVLSECVEGGFDYFGPDAAQTLRYTARSEAHTEGRYDETYYVDDYSLRPGASLTRAMEPGGGLVRMSWNPSKFARRA